MAKAQITVVRYRMSNGGGGPPLRPQHSTGKWVDQETMSEWGAPYNNYPYRNKLLIRVSYYFVCSLISHLFANLFSAQNVRLTILQFSRSYVNEYVILLLETCTDVCVRI